MEVGSSSGLDSTLMRISSTLRRAVGALPVATCVQGLGCSIWPADMQATSALDAGELTAIKEQEDGPRC